MVGMVDGSGDDGGSRGGGGGGFRSGGSGVGLGVRFEGE